MVPGEVRVAVIVIVIIDATRLTFGVGLQKISQPGSSTVTEGQKQKSRTHGHKSFIEIYFEKSQGMQKSLKRDIENMMNVLNKGIFAFTQ